LVLATCSTAWSQTPPPAKAKPAAKAPNVEPKKDVDAQRALQAGEAKLQSNDIAGALADFQRSNEAVPSPVARYKIAWCFDQLGKSTEAADAYRSFLAEPPRDDLSEQRQRAQTRLLELTTASVKVTTAPPGASLKVDGATESAVTPTTLQLNPGRHAIEVAANGYEPANRELEVIAGGSGELALDLVPIPAQVAAASLPPATTPAAPPTKAPPASKLPAYVTLGIGGAGAIVGTIFGVRALSARSDFNKNPTVARADTAEQSALVSDMAFGVAITLGITGAVLLLSHPDKPAEASPTTQAPRRPSPSITGFRLAPVVTPQAQGAAAFFRF